MKKAAIILFAAIMILTLFACVKSTRRSGATATPPTDAASVTSEPIGTPESEITIAPVTAESIVTPEPEITSAPATEAPVSGPVIEDAILQEYIDANGNDMILITVTIPAMSTIRIDFPHQTDYEVVNNEEKISQRIIKIPVEVFYKNAPLTEATVVFTPDITITTADGTVHQVPCASFTRTFPKLNITVIEPVPDEDGVIMAPESNVVQIRGSVDPAPDPIPDAITVNGVSTTVYEGGSFMYEYHLADGIGEDDSEEVTIIARKNDHVIDSKTITIHAYKFVPDPMTLEVRNDLSAMRADKNGKLTVSGVTLPGATLSAISDNTSNVLCGSVTVDPEGNFSFQVTMDPTFYGMSVITLHAEKEGAEEKDVKFTVTKGFADRASFTEYYVKAKKLIEINIKSGNVTYRISDLLDNLAQYANASYGVRVAATVEEIIEADGNTVVKMTVLKTGETIYVHNLCDKWTPEQNIGTKYNIWGNLMGTYGETGCCEFLGWFAKAVK